MKREVEQRIETAKAQAVRQRNIVYGVEDKKEKMVENYDTVIEYIEKSKNIEEKIKEINRKNEEENGIEIRISREDVIERYKREYEKIERVEKEKNKIEIMKIEYINILSYEKKTLIELDKMEDGIYLISGENGSGKSSIINIILYGLYGNRSGMMMNEMITIGKERGIIRIKLKKGEDEYEIIRKLDIKNGETLKIKRNGEKITGSTKRESENKIEEIVGNKDTLLNTSIRMQEGKNITSLDGREMKELIIKIMDIETHAKTFENFKISNSNYIKNEKGVIKEMIRKLKEIKDVEEINKEVEKKEGRIKELRERQVKMGVNSGLNEIMRKIIKGEIDINRIEEEEKEAVEKIKENEIKREEIENIEKEIMRKRCSIEKVEEMEEKRGELERIMRETEGKKREEIERKIREEIEDDRRREEIRRIKEINKYYIEHKFSEKCEECRMNRELHEKIGYEKKIRMIEKEIKSEGGKKEELKREISKLEERENLERYEKKREGEEKKREKNKKIEEEIREKEEELKIKKKKIKIYKENIEKMDKIKIYKKMRESYKGEEDILDQLHV